MSHPFYVYKFGWTTARALRAGDVLVLLNGELVTVEWIDHEILKEPIYVYNFEVEDFHTYFVGESGILVHNGRPCTPVDGYSDDINKESWLAKKDGTVDWKSEPNFGHTFDTQGAGKKNTEALTGRAKSINKNGKQNPQGQWLDNQKAAEYLNDYGRIEYSNPPVEIPIPDGLGQVIHPNGSITPATKARVVINRKTGKIRSAIPID